MKRALKTLCITTALVTFISAPVSAATATVMPETVPTDSAQFGEITAFNGVESNLVSMDEQAQVSGEFVVPILVRVAGVWILKRVVAQSVKAALNKLDCGTWKTCRVQ